MGRLGEKGGAVPDRESAAAAVKEEALGLGASAVGVASAASVDRFAPLGHRPGDLLEGARSVVVVAGAAPTAGAWRSGSARVLGSVGYNRGDLAGVARRLARYVEGRFGNLALPLPTGNKVGHVPYISLKLCAELAGLGSRSLAGGVILNPEYGLLYFNGVVTTLPLTEDGPLAEPVCPAPSCVRVWERKQTTPCLSACPECLSGEIREGRIEWLEYRQDRCYPRAQTTAMDAFQKLLLAALEEPDADRRRAIVFGSHFSRTVRSLGYSSELSAQCFQCLRRCPVVRRYVRRFR